MKVRFGDVVKEVKVNIDRAQNPYEFYVAGDHMDSEDFKICRRGRFATDDVGPAFTRYFKPGQILYGSRRAYLKKVCVADFEGICANTTFVFESKDANKLDQRMLPFLMLSDGFTKWSIQHSKGSTNPYVLFSDLTDYEFDLPPIEKQRELAELLWAANDLKESYKKLIVATDEMLKAKFREMFGDGELVASEGIVDLESVCETFIDGDWIEAKDQSDSGIRLVQTGNVGDGVYLDRPEKARWISEQTFSRLHCTDIVAGDILISRLPDPIGRACILPEGLGRAITAVDCTIVRLHKVILPHFLIAITQSTSYMMQIAKLTAGTTRARVSRGNLGKIKIPLPPLSLQQEFVEIARKSDETKAALKKSIADVESMIKGIING